MGTCNECQLDMWDGDGVALCSLHAQAGAMRELLKHVPHNRTFAVHRWLGEQGVAGCPGCEARALLAATEVKP